MKKLVQQPTKLDLGEKQYSHPSNENNQRLLSLIYVAGN